MAWSHDYIVNKSYSSLTIHRKSRTLTDLLNRLIVEYTDVKWDKLANGQCKNWEINIKHCVTKIVTDATKVTFYDKDWMINQNIRIILKYNLEIVGIKAQIDPTNKTYTWPSDS